MQVVVSCPFFVVSEAVLGQGYLEVSSFCVSFSRSIKRLLFASTFSYRSGFLNFLIHGLGI